MPEQQTAAPAWPADTKPTPSSPFPAGEPHRVRPAQRRRRRLVTTVVAALVVVAAVVGALWFLNGRGSDDGALSLPRGTAHEAGLAIAGSAETVSITADAPSDTLVAVTVGEGGEQPTTLEPTAPSPTLTLGGAPATVSLAAGVAWNLNLTSSADTVTADLTGAGVQGITLGGGASKVELTLPAPDGRVVVNQPAGLGSLVVHLPAGVGVLVDVVNGAGSITIDGTTKTAVGAGEKLTSDGFDDAGPAYVISVGGGIGELVVDHT